MKVGDLVWIPRLKDENNDDFTLDSVPAVLTEVEDGGTHIVCSNFLSCGGRVINPSGDFHIYSTKESCDRILGRLSKELKK